MKLGYPQTNSLSFFINDHFTFRCDRSIRNTKGGVLTSVQQCLKPFLHQSFSNGKFESLTVLLTLSPTTILSITNIYRSPDLNLKEFTNKLEFIISSSVPAIILGDFNVNLIDQQNCLLLNFMNSRGFSQVVSQPTTDNGTLIDHIDVRNTPISFNANIEIHDTYYLDHDCIVMEISIS